MKRGSKHSPESIAKMCAAHEGFTPTDEHRAKLAVATRRRYEDPAERQKTSERLISRPVSTETRVKMSVSAKKRAEGEDRTGERNPCWRNHEIGYTTAHRRARKALATQPCAHGDETCAGRLEVAFNHDTLAEFTRVDAGRPFSPYPEHYKRLCKSHHTRYDARRIAAAA